MKYIIAGTNRPQSRTLGIAKLIQDIYRNLGEQISLIDLAEVPLEYRVQSYTGPHRDPLQAEIKKVNHADGLIIVCPEYNGSYPGALKFFIDHWSYPETFEYRPVCFVGLGGRFGALRPIEHLQQVFGYRNAYVFPQRVFLFNIWETFKEGVLRDEASQKLLKEQAEGFQKFVLGLRSQGLDANSRQPAKK